MIYTQKDDPITIICRGIALTKTAPNGIDRINITPVKCDLGYNNGCMWFIAETMKATRGWIEIQEEINSAPIIPRSKEEVTNLLRL